MAPLTPILTTLAGLAGMGGLSGPAAIALGSASVTLMARPVATIVMNPTKFWRTLTSSPIKGDAVLVEIYGADLAVRGTDERGDAIRDTSANAKFQSWWSKPDCYVKFRHGSQRGQTQVEGGTFFPRFYFTQKLAYARKDGFEFQVWESNLLSDDRIVGRCWVPAHKAQEAMRDDTPVFARLGAGIGMLKVSFTGPLPYAYRQGTLLSAQENKTRQFIKDHHEFAHVNEASGKLTEIDN
mmetsp:Transcript_8734/g.26277  ORF Transcript_8734/g.26277 Transcript_8734/m.26277 type:complete len:239 (-) Transcript_8734:62-778(-)